MSTTSSAENSLRSVRGLLDEETSQAERASAMGESISSCPGGC